MLIEYNFVRKLLSAHRVAYSRGKRSLYNISRSVEVEEMRRPVACIRWVMKIHTHSNPQYTCKYAFMCYVLWICLFSVCQVRHIAQSKIKFARKDSLCKQSACISQKTYYYIVVKKTMRAVLVFVSQVFRLDHGGILGFGRLEK